MENEGSSPCSQEPSTGPYPQPDEPSSHPHTVSLKSFHLSLGLASGLFPSGFPTIRLLCKHLSSLPCSYNSYMPRPSHIPCVDHPKYLVNRTISCEASHYALLPRRSASTLSKGRENRRMKKNNIISSLNFCRLSIHWHLSDLIKECQMGEECSTHWEDKKWIGLHFSRKTSRDDSFLKI
jgi:hypothetical protein